MINIGKCQMAACNCSVPLGETYCSQDCRQAVEQGLEREFCQCFHASCKADLSTILDVDLAGLSDSFRFFEAGQITIDYRNKDHLVGQLQALAACLAPQDGRYDLHSPQIGSEDLERRPAKLEVGPVQAEAQSA